MLCLPPVPSSQGPTTSPLFDEFHSRDLLKETTHDQWAYVALNGLHRTLTNEGFSVAEHGMSPKIILKNKDKKYE